MYQESRIVKLPALTNEEREKAKRFWEVVKQNENAYFDIFHVYVTDLFPSVSGFDEDLLATTLLDVGVEAVDWNGRPLGNGIYAGGFYYSGRYTFALYFLSDGSLDFNTYPSKATRQETLFAKIHDEGFRIYKSEYLDNMARKSFLEQDIPPPVEYSKHHLAVYLVNTLTYPYKCQKYAVLFHKSTPIQFVLDSITAELKEVDIQLYYGGKPIKSSNLSISLEKLGIQTGKSIIISRKIKVRPVENNLPKHYRFVGELVVGLSSGISSENNLDRVVRMINVRHGIRLLGQLLQRAFKIRVKEAFLREEWAQKNEKELYALLDKEEKKKSGGRGKKKGSPKQTKAAKKTESKKCMGKQTLASATTEVSDRENDNSDDISDEEDIDENLLHAFRNKSIVDKLGKATSEPIRKAQPPQQQQHQEHTTPSLTVASAVHATIPSTSSTTTAQTSHVRDSVKQDRNYDRTEKHEKYAKHEQKRVISQVRKANNNFGNYSNSANIQSSSQLNVNHGLTGQRNGNYNSNQAVSSEQKHQQTNKQVVKQAQLNESPVENRKKVESVVVETIVDKIVDSEQIPNIQIEPVPSIGLDQDNDRSEDDILLSQTTSDFSDSDVLRESIDSLVANTFVSNRNYPVTLESNNVEPNYYPNMNDSYYFQQDSIMPPTYTVPPPPQYYSPYPPPGMSPASAHGMMGNMMMPPQPYSMPLEMNAQHHHQFMHPPQYPTINPPPFGHMPHLPMPMSSPYMQGAFSHMESYPDMGFISQSRNTNEHQSTSTFINCTSCGFTMRKLDTFCKNCGMEYPMTESIKLPPSLLANSSADQHTTTNTSTDIYAMPNLLYDPNNLLH